MRDISKKREYMRRYRKENSEKVAATKLRWWHENKHRLTEEQRARRLEASRRWRKRNPEKLAAVWKKWRDKNRDKIAEKNKTKEQRAKAAQYCKLRRRAKKEHMATRPRPKQCEVCNKVGRVEYDHCHQTGVFRGWLCHSCNKTLGFAQDDANLLRKLIVYIDDFHSSSIRFPERPVSGSWQSLMNQ